MHTPLSERGLKTLTEEQCGRVREHLEEILASQVFSGSPRAQQFLELVVHHALNGELEQLRERMIGAEMFGRPIDYDTGSDPVVRVKASEVRKKLAQYYSEVGHPTELRIELPSGSYVPIFSFAHSAVVPPPVATEPPASSTGQPEAVPKFVSIAGADASSPKRRPWYRRPLAWALAALALLAGIVIYVWWYRHSNAQKTIHAIAILPFENISGNPDQDYLADGITDELIAEMGQATRLRVTSRTSAMSLRNSKKLLPEIASELHVDAVVEGTVQREGNQVRITAQLIDARHDQFLWSSTYNRALANVLTLQNELAQEIADQVRNRVSLQGAAHAVSPEEVHSDAIEFYLKGIQKADTGQFSDAISLFERAVNIAPNFARPYAAMASCYGQMGEEGLMSYAEAFSKQKANALRAIELDDSLAEGHAELANAAMNLSWDWNTAEKEFHRALELNPSLATAHERYAVYLERVGQFDEAIAEVERGVVLDPASDRALQDKAFTYYFTRHYDRALEVYREARASRVLKQDNRFLLGDVYAEKKQYAKAIVAFAAGGSNAHSLGHLGNAYARAGQLEQAHRVIAQLESQVQKDGLGRYEIALVYAGLGDPNSAFLWLENSFKARNEGLTNLNIDPCLDPLRSDPRFADLVRRVGLQIR